MPKSHTPDTLAFTPATLRERHNGWSAERQRDFIEALADSGCVAQASRVVGVSTKSAYRLRRHPKGKDFAFAWDQALRCASARLVDIAMERAVHGSRRQYWRDGELIGESVIPSDALLMFMLARLDTGRFGSQVDRHPAFPDRAGYATQTMAKLLGGLRDIDAPAEPLAISDGSAGVGVKGGTPLGWS